MNASYDWLKAFVDFDLTPAELRDLITRRVATVDELVALRADLAPIVVARVAEAKRHPNSDHLWVTKVDAGGPELLDVVCGAPNVQQGKLYPFAPTGTVMPGGLRIERRKIRGETSNGMLCSARELGLGQEHDGIMELSVSAPPGTPFLRALPVGDTRLVLDVLPNRPDLLAHVGVAREIAAAVGRPLRLPEIPEAAPAGEGAAPPAAGVTAVDVRVDDVAGAPRYAGRLVRGVTVGPSPAWLAARIEAVGGRPINNVVDATNYVMHELGQPLHAFDAAKLAGRRVVVRRARAGETLVTLDGVERALDPEMTVIADAERPQAVAGVMGGASSEVTDGTTDIFLESATFDPRRVRATRRRLGLSTDASYRFERGVDPELAPFALERVTQVLRAVAGGEPAGEAVDVYPVPRPPVALSLRTARIARLLGEPVPAEEAAALLGAVGFGVQPGDDDATLRVAVPSWRGDVVAEVDLIEEVARLRGYDSFSDELRPYRPGRVPDAPLHLTARRIREAMVAAGLLETRAMPFVAGDDAGYVRVLNPLAENEAHLRRSVLETLARRAEYNLAHMQRNVRLFEIGAVFAPDDAGAGTLPREETRAAALVMGLRRPPHFTESDPPDFDEWDAKGVAERLAESAFPGAAIELRPAGGGGEVLWEVAVDGAVRGTVRRLSLDAPAWAAPAFGIEVELGVVDSGRVAPPGENAHVEPGTTPERPTPLPAYRPLPSMPPVSRDVTLLLPPAVRAADVERVIRDAAGEILESAAVTADYRGAELPAGTRAVTWKLTFRHPERTLRDKEVDGRREKLLRTLEAELGVIQRS
ncbi:MAG: phenylalanine--tRNA ligase subunit beta [Gemmatimonadaceae bacterium]